MDKNGLYRFFSNQSTPEEEKKVLDWLDLSSENRKIFLEERNLFDTIVFNDGEQAFAKGGKSYIKKNHTIRIWAKELGKIAAIAAIFISISLFYVDKQKKALTSAMNTISVPAGQRVDLTLPDGTRVSMNSMSEIQYPMLFGKNRIVTLKGEAYFEVTHNKKKPFIVETEDYGVEVLGTTFNINSDIESDIFTTSLIGGEIKVFNLKNRDESIILKPNEEVSLQNGELVLQLISDFDRFRWKDGLFCFKNTPLEELFPQIEKYYDVKIINEAKNKPVSKEISGKIRISEGIEHVLRVLLKDSDFTYEKKDNVIYIK